MVGDRTPDMQPVLRCGECSKPFDKEATLKRHIYYCRSRRGGPNAGRPRSCLSCAKAKTACDSIKPQCSRCRTKSIACNYPVRTQRSKHTTTGAITRLGDNTFVEPGNNPSPARPAELPNTFADSRNESAIDRHHQNELDNASISEFVNFEDDYLEWNDTVVSLPNFLQNTQVSETNKGYLSPMSLPWSPSSTPTSYQTTATPQQFNYTVSPSQLSIPMGPTLTIRSLARRPKLELGGREQRITNLILHTLKSYPMMMMRQNTLPPFIHPILLSPDQPENLHMESLMNCMNLVNMISNGGQGSRKLFWKNVRMECERLSGQRDKLNKWEVLAAMQAVFIYILIRLDEGEKEYNNLDVLLVKTVIETATQLAYTQGSPAYTGTSSCDKQCALCNNELDLSWKEWIFRESKRRLAIVYRVADMLVYFEPVSMCSMPGDFILGPLPARKQLWEAGDELSWMAEGKNEPGINISFGLDRCGDIVKLDEGRLSCNDMWLSGVKFKTKAEDIGVRSEGSWEEWCAGIDGLGGLVMLAASLVS